jgi:hypothetical protein
VTVTTDHPAPDDAAWLPALIVVTGRPGADLQRPASETVPPPRSAA